MDVPRSNEESDTEGHVRGDVSRVEVGVTPRKDDREDYGP